MSQVNPFVAAILPSATTQKQESSERVGQVRRTQDARKNSALSGKDTFEHEVESTDAVAGVHDEDTHPDQKRKSRNKHQDQSGAANADDDGESHLDLTA